MAKLNLPPTKSNQLRLRGDLKMAEDGFGLLDQKREILVMELLRLLSRVKGVQEKLDQARIKAYGTGRKAFTMNGYHHMRRVANGIHYDHRITLRERVVAGVRIPTISAENGGLKRQFGLTDTDSLTDETMANFLDMLAVVGEMAQLEAAVWLLARELKKTQRRCNALEQIFIPDFAETLRHIDETLAGKELESFTLMKLVKNRRSADRDPEKARC